MNKSDKYYLKQGKLELSMLDDELEHSSKTGQVEKKDIFADIEFPHTKRLKDVQPKEPKLKVTQDIYNTLHTMGQFLTKAEEVDDLAAIKPIVSKKAANSAKVQKLEQIASTLRIQDVALPPREIIEKDNNFSEEDNHLSPKQDQSAVYSSLEKEEVESQIKTIDSFMQGDSIVLEAPESELNLQSIQLVKQENQEADLQTKQTVYVPNGQLLDGPKRIEDFFESSTKDEESSKKESTQGKSKDEQALNEKKQKSIECTVEDMYSDIANKVEGFYKQQNNGREESFFNEQPYLEKELTQNKIDEVIKEHLGEVTQKYAYAKELKRHIDKQIDAIRNYE